MTPDKSPSPQHLRATPEEVLSKWRKGHYTAKGYIYDLLLALRKQGWWFRVDSISQFCQEWEIQRRSFYRAKTQLIAAGDLEEDIIGAVNLRIPIMCATNVTHESQESQDPGALTETSGSPVETSGSPVETPGSPVETSGSHLVSESPSGQGLQRFSRSFSTISTDLSQKEHLSETDVSDLAEEEGDSETDRPPPTCQESDAQTDPPEQTDAPEGTEEVPAASSKACLKLKWLQEVFLPNYPYRLTESGEKVRNLGPIAGAPGNYLKYLTVEAVESGQATEALRAMVRSRLADYRAKYPGTDPPKVTPRGQDKWVYALPYVPDPAKWFKERRWLSDMQAPDLEGDSSPAAGLHWSDDWEQISVRDLSEAIALIKPHWTRLALKWDDPRLRDWLQKAQQLEAFELNLKMGYYGMPDWVVEKLAHDLVKTP